MILRHAPKLAVCFRFAEVEILDDVGLCLVDDLAVLQVLLAGIELRPERFLVQEHQHGDFYQ